MVVGSRDSSDRADVFECYRADSGKLAWVQTTDAPGELDYGNSPRATPLIADGFVFTVGAFGDVRSIDLETGAIIWETHLVKQLGGKVPDWGFSGSPLLVSENLILQPGGRDVSLIALDYITGDVVWKSAGNPTAYASLVVNDNVQPNQIVGLDATGICGWTLAGKLLWRREPQVAGDFGVPSPVPTPFGLVLTSENNGTRIFTYDDSGVLQPDPATEVNLVNPNSHTPVAIGTKLVVADDGLECFDLENKLDSIWKLKDRAMRGYASLIVTTDRVLMLTENGTLFLVQLDTGAVLGRLSLSEQPLRVLSAPALVGNRLYVRLDRQLLCIAL